jgi:hypothetical protein
MALVVLLVLGTDSQLISSLEEPVSAAQQLPVLLLLLLQPLLHSQSPLSPPGQPTMQREARQVNWCVNSICSMIALVPATQAE